MSDPLLGVDGTEIVRRVIRAVGAQFAVGVTIGSVAYAIPVPRGTVSNSVEQVIDGAYAIH
jgi:hypothetical protein